MVDYLKAHRDAPIMQLTIALGMSRAAIQRKLDEFDGKPPPKKDNRKTKIGKREDILVNGRPLFVRSGWEANVLRLLTYKQVKWEYESKVFFFEGIKRGTVSYCPDIVTPKLYIEIKGQLTSKGRAAIRRFKKYYPDEFKKLRVIVGRKGTKADKFFKELGVPVYAYYNELDKKYRNVISNWE